MSSANNCSGSSAKFINGALLSRIAVALLFFAIAAVSADAQVQNGIFTGTVTDPQGAAVANADMTITNVGTNATVTIKTNAEGSYRIRLNGDRCIRAYVRDGHVSISHRRALRIRNRARKNAVLNLRIGA